MDGESSEEQLYQPGKYDPSLEFMQPWRSQIAGVGQADV